VVKPKNFINGKF